jgi:hypothetical protein
LSNTSSVFCSTFLVMRFFMVRQQIQTALVVSTPFVTAFIVTNTHLRHKADAYETWCLFGAFVSMERSL